MEILINFILKNSSSHASCRFWSCMLETTKELSGKDFADLNRNSSNKEKLQSYSNLSINAEYSVYNQDIVGECFGKGNPQPRPAIFLPCNNSPYRNRSSYITSYYSDEKQFQFELLKCVSVNNSVCSPIDYLSIQKEAVLAIKKIIGFDLLECSSIPGCLSIYEKLPLFDDDDYNFNQKKGSRYIVIKPPLTVPDGFSGEFSATIEALDRGKILYRRIVFFSSSYRINFPNNNELEDFYEIRISICGKTNEEFIPLYEVHHTMIKSFSINGSVSGGRSRLLVNRYKGKTIDQVAQLDSFGSDSTTRNKTDWSDKDYNYKLETEGSPAEYLVSKFFDKTSVGREEFLDWTRKLFQNVKSVVVIDPYFDLNGFHDFLSCVNMPFDLTILTTDPAKQSRSEDNKAYSDENVKSLANEIFSAFPNAKIYFDGEDSFHDRYFIIDGKRFFSMSNSWNGSVNNFSMFVQELNLECSLKVEESFNRIQDKSVLQEKKQEPVDTSRLEQRKNDIEKYEPLIDSSRDAIKKLAESGSDEYERIASEYDFDKFYELLYTVFKCQSFGMYKRKDDDHPYTDDVIIEVCSKAVKNICAILAVPETESTNYYIEKLIRKTVKELLENQRDIFIKTGELFGGKPLSVYNTIDKILKRVSQVEFIGNPTYKYDIDYCRYSILKCCFVVAPTLVIKELEEQEKEICKIDIVIKHTTGTAPAKIETRPYYESEIILAAMLSQIYELVNVDDIDATIDFILRTEFLYCKLYYAMTFIDYRIDTSFSSVKDHFEKLQLSNEELAAVLGELYAYKNSSRASSNEEVRQKQSLLDEILDYSIAKLNVPLSSGDSISDKKILPMLRFVFTAFVFRNANLNVDLVLEVVKKCENIVLEEIFCKLLLIHALEKVSNRQLYNFVLKNSGLSEEMKAWFFAMQKELPKFSDDYPEMKQNSSIVDMEYFINNIPSLGTILNRYYLLDASNNLRKNMNVESERQLDVLNGILFKIDLHLKLLFETSEYIGSIDFDYYVLLIILYSFVDLKEVLNERSASESQKEQVEHRIKEEFEKIEWYFPFAINALSDDFYGLVYEFLDVYLSFKDDSEKKLLFDSINAPALKVFIGSKIDDFLFENESYKKLFSEVLSNDEFDSFDRTKKIIYLLNIFASVVLCTSDSYKTVANEILDRIISMLSKLNNEKISAYIKLGKVYFDNKTSDSLKEFSKQMNKLYFPISLREKTELLLKQGAEE